MTPTLHMSVEKLTGSKATTSGAMNSGVPCNTFTGVPGAAERMQEASWDWDGPGTEDTPTQPGWRSCHPPRLLAALGALPEPLCVPNTHRHRGPGWLHPGSRTGTHSSAQSWWLPGRAQAGHQAPRCCARPDPVLCSASPCPDPRSPWCSPSFRAKPKSMILIQWLPGLTQTMFSGLRSRWTMAWLCMKCSPSRICCTYWALLGSVCSKSSSTMRSKSSPPATLGTTRCGDAVGPHRPEEGKPQQRTRTEHSGSISSPLSPGAVGTTSTPHQHPVVH